MRGIADHAGAPDDEAIERLASQKRPFEGHVDVLDDGVDRAVPSRKGAAAGFAGALLGPGLHRPVLALEDADEVEKLAAADWISDDMTAGSHPIGADVALHVQWQAVHRHQAAPGRNARKERFCIAADLPSDFRVDAIRADHHVATSLLTIGEPEPDSAVVFLKTGAAAADMQRPRRAGVERIDQHAMKITPMHHPVRRAIDRARGGTEIEQLPGPPGREQADLLARGFAGDALHRLFETECDQNARAVRGELNAGAELAQLGGLLENLDLDAALEQRQPRDETSDARAGDQDFWRIWRCAHTGSVALSTADQEIVGELAARNFYRDFAVTPDLQDFRAGFILRRRQQLDPLGDALGLPIGELPGKAAAEVAHAELIIGRRQHQRIARGRAGNTFSDRDRPRMFGKTPEQLRQRRKIGALAEKQEQRMEIARHVFKSQHVPFRRAPYSLNTFTMSVAWQSSIAPTSPGRPGDSRVRTCSH